MRLPQYIISYRNWEEVWRITSRVSEAQSLEIGCWHGDIFATWKSSLKDLSFIEDKDESEEHDEDMRF